MSCVAADVARKRSLTAKSLNAKHRSKSASLSLAQVVINKSFNNFQRRDVTTILIGLNNFKNLLHFVMKKKKSFVGHLY
jgi:hypothetical protein